MKFLTIGLIASVIVLSGCATGGDKTAVTVYDSTGNKVQETTKDAVMLNSAYTMATECNRAKVDIAKNNNLGVINAVDLKGLSSTAQTEYMRTLPMIYMATALQSAVSKESDGCQDAIVAYYNHANVKTQASTQLWSKGLGILGFLGGTWLIGNSVEGIVSSISGSGGTTNTISGSRVTQDSGNTYNGNANASSSGDGLGSSNVFPRGNTNSSIYGGNQPRATTTNLNDQNGSIDFGSNSGDNAPQGILEPVEAIAPIE